MSIAMNKIKEPIIGDILFWEVCSDLDSDFIDHIQWGVIYEIAETKPFHTLSVYLINEPLPDKTWYINRTIYIHYTEAVTIYDSSIHTIDLIKSNG